MQHYKYTIFQSIYYSKIAVVLVVFVEPLRGSKYIFTFLLIVM
jgi:hypothetical protein